MEDDDEDSTGLHLWSLAGVLKAILVQYPGLYQSKSVLELGCGSNPVTLAIKATCDTTIVVADYQPKAIDRVRCLPDFIAASFIQAQVFDWSVDKLSQPVDVIVASEILYYAVDIDALFRCVYSMLKPSGIFILVSQQRGTVMRSMRDASIACHLSLHLYDIFAYEYQVLKSGIPLGSYPILAIMTHQIESLLICEYLQLSNFKLSVEDLINAEETPEEFVFPDL